MTIHLVNGNIFNAPLNQIICHQVNCQGKMGKGIAETVKKKHPDIYEEYVRICETTNPFARVFVAQEQEDKHVIANLFAQYYYGTDKRYTDYEAVAKCLEKISIYAIEKQLDLAFPYGMGCNNAGGNWEIIYTMIDEICARNDVFIYKKF